MVRIVLGSPLESGSRTTVDRHQIGGTRRTRGCLVRPGLAILISVPGPSVVWCPAIPPTYDSVALQGGESTQGRPDPVARGRPSRRLRGLLVHHGPHLPLPTSLPNGWDTPFVAVPLLPYRVNLGVAPTAGLLLLYDRRDRPPRGPGPLKLADQLHPVPWDHPDGDLDGTLRQRGRADDRGLQDGHDHRDGQ